MGLEAIKQATGNYAAASTQINMPTQPTAKVNGVTAKADASGAKNEFSLDETGVVYGDEKFGIKKEGEEATSNNTEALKNAVESINKKMSNSVAQYGIHEATNRVTIKIVDKTTKKVIKEFPPEETLDMIAKAWELAGLMVDEKR